MSEEQELPPPERRASYRLNKVLGAEIEHEGSKLQARLFVIDISATGFRATNQFPLPAEVEIVVRITLEPKTEPIESRARIVWTKELPTSGMFQFGFEFLEMGEGPRQRLESFIEKERAQSLAPQKDLYLGRPWTPLR